MAMKDCCKTCRYFFVMGRLRGDECRRYAPQAIADVPPDKFAYRPMTFANGWCGDHTPASEPDPKQSQSDIL